MISQVIFRYLDRRSVAISVLRDYRNMENIINTSKDKVNEEQMKLYSFGSYAMDGMPHIHDNHAGENRIVNIIDKIDFIKERYENAMEYMSWVKPAWNSLSEDDRYILSEFYVEDRMRGDYVAEGIADSMCMCSQSVHNRKNKALERFSSLLFGIK